ncbi:IS6 family transposase [Shimia sp.]|uniref:IS6 family transposase n=1 Tax=Shimia sp. TaxID=1954381 RepID=UPI0032972762
MMYVRFPLSLRNVEDLLHERGVDVSHEMIRFCWNRFGPLFAAEIRRKRASRMRCYSNWQWHMDEVFVKINGVQHYLWRAVDHEGEVLESYVTKRRDRAAALKFMRKAMKRYGKPEVVVTDKLHSYSAAMKVIGNSPGKKRAVGRIIVLRIHIYLFEGERGPCTVFVACEVYRNSSSSTRQFSITSIRVAAFPKENISR